MDTGLGAKKINSEKITGRLITGAKQQNKQDENWEK